MGGGCRRPRNTPALVRRGLAEQGETKIEPGGYAPGRKEGSPKTVCELPEGWMAREAFAFHPVV
jgi:hypothetical protein